MSRYRSARHAAWKWLLSVRPQRRHLGAVLLAGVPGAIGSVPDGMAAAILAGVNPVQGLYAAFAGPITGGLTANTRLMVITTTSASALAAGPALTDYAGRLADVDGRLYLSGLDPSLTERLRRTGRIGGPIRTFEATPLLGESTEAARRAAEAWLVRKRAD